MLSEAERKYMEDGADAGLRQDGRAALDLRPVSLATSVLPNASGSARVRIGAVTDILVGVKAEVAEPTQEAADEGILSFAVDCTSLASPDFVGRGAADLNAELSQFLMRLYGGSVVRRLRKKLCLIPGKKCWVLHIDALVLDSGGNLFSALSLAVRAALRVVVLPGVIIVEGEADEDDDIEIDEDAFHLLQHTKDAPISITLSMLGSKGTFIADCSSEEEKCAKFALAVGVNREGLACGAISTGAGIVDMDTLGRMLEVAVKLGCEMLETTDDFLSEDIEKRLLDDANKGVGLFA